MFSYISNFFAVGAEDYATDAIVFLLLISVYDYEVLIFLYGSISQLLAVRAENRTSCEVIMWLTPELISKGVEIDKKVA